MIMITEKINEVTALQQLNGTENKTGVSEKKTVKKAIKKAVENPLAEKKNTKKTTQVKSPLKTGSIVANEKKGAVAVAKKTASKKVSKTVDNKTTPIKKQTVDTALKIIFMLKFHTKYGQSVYITANHEIFGNGDPLKAVPMQYLSEELWTFTLDIKSINVAAEGIVYNYILKNKEGEITLSFPQSKFNEPSSFFKM